MLEDYSDRFDLDGRVDFFWTKRKIEQFNQSKVGIVLNRLIEEENWDLICRYISEVTSTIVEKSVVRKVLTYMPDTDYETSKITIQSTNRFSSLKNNAHLIYKDNSESAVVSFVSNEIVFPLYNVNSNVELKFQDVTRNSGWRIYMIANGLGNALMNEEINNFLGLVNYSAKNENIVSHVKDLRDAHGILNAYDSIASQGIVTKNVIMDAATYTKMWTYFNEKLLQASQDLRTIFESKEFGKFLGCDVFVVPEFKNKIAFISDGFDSGVIATTKTRTFHDKVHSKMKHNFTCGYKLGLCIANEFSCSIVDATKKEDAKKE